MALAKCIMVGIGTALLGVGVCMLSLPLLLSIRELGLAILLVLIPLGIWCSRVITRKYLARATSRSRGALAWGAHYLLVGAGLALIFKLFVIGGAISDTPFIVFVGSVIGTVSGSMGGAFHGWLASRRNQIESARTP